MPPLRARDAPRVCKPPSATVHALWDHRGSCRGRKCGGGARCGVPGYCVCGASGYAVDWTGAIPRPRRSAMLPAATAPDRVAEDGARCAIDVRPSLQCGGPQMRHPALTLHALPGASPRHPPLQVNPAANNAGGVRPARR